MTCLLVKSGATVCKTGKKVQRFSEDAMKSADGFFHINSGITLQVLFIYWDGIIYVLDSSHDSVAMRRVSRL